ncbi:MAG: metal ABC transporter permease [Gammaproteobacteria bacterium]|nr:metal ABC transporter permease [Gammaproteobacteria bacterium]
MNVEGLDISILAPAFLAGIIILLTHIPLGREVIKRGIIFIDLAIAQIAGLGVIIAFQFGGEMHGLEAQAAAITSALMGAWLLHSIEKKAGEHLEALIGVSFVLAATASILMLAHNPHGSEHLKELLVGQILWVDWSQILVAAVVSLIVVFVWFNYKNKIGNIGFYILFAVSITSAVQLIGVYLVFTSLIVPALAAAKYQTKPALILAGIIGITGYLSGLIASALFDLPSGAVIVWCLAISALVLPALLSNFFTTVEDRS